MKGRTVSSMLLILLIPAVFGCQLKTNGVQTEPVSHFALKNQDDKIAYSLGVEIGNDLQNLEVKSGSTAALVQGIRDSVQGNVPLLTLEEMERMRRTFLAERAVVRSKELGPAAEKNLAEGELFLRENAKKEGVKVLPSGVQYRVVEEGMGGVPDLNDTVRVHYVIKTVDGKELQSSYPSGKPAVIPVKGGIPAWSEALRLMNEGGKWELFVPGHLAYGDRGVRDMIGPYQALIFELQLVDIVSEQSH